MIITTIKEVPSNVMNEMIYSYVEFRYQFYHGYKSTIVNSIVNVLSFPFDLAYGIIGKTVLFTIHCLLWFPFHIEFVR
jgi:hypothetical protein